MTTILTLLIAAIIFGLAIFLISISKNDDYVFVKGSIDTQYDEHNKINKILRYNVNNSSISLPLSEISNIDYGIFLPGDEIDVAYKKKDPSKVTIKKIKYDKKHFIFYAFAIFIFGIVCFWFINKKKGLPKWHGIAESIGSIISIARHI